MLQEKSMNGISRINKFELVKLSSTKFAVYKKNFPLYVMLIPGIIIAFIFYYIPMGGIIIAFQKFIPALGLFGKQKWVGLENFIYVFNMPDSFTALRNTLSISVFKIVLGLLIPIIFAVMLNELRHVTFKRTIQTMVYLPHFLSWVILGGMFINILSPSNGVVNKIITNLGGEPLFFLGSNKLFQPTLIITDIWKDFGFNSIVFLSAITGIDPELYDSAVVDGANRWQKIICITVPSIMMIVVLMGVLKLGTLLSAGFDQVFNMYSPVVYETGDILDTLVYRLGIVQSQYSVSAALGLFKSLVSLILVSGSYFMADKFAGYRIF